MLTNDNGVENIFDILPHTQSLSWKKRPGGTNRKQHARELSLKDIMEEEEFGVEKQRGISGKQTPSSEEESNSSSPPAPRLLARRRRAIAACSSSSTSAPNEPIADAIQQDSHRKQRRGGISVQRGPDQETLVTVTGESLAVRLESKLELLLSQVEYGLLAGSAGNETCRVTTRRFDRFLMQHTRQKKRPLADLPSDEEFALLDFAYYQQALKVLSRVGQWNFNTFLLDSMTGGRSLPTLLIHLFQSYNLIEIFRLDIVKLWKCLVMIEEGYHSNNPYHNAVHATDVTQAMHCFLQEVKIRDNITPLEVMTSLLAAVSHDLDHPGVNQPFLVATSNHLAALYKNSSVLENHHWRSAMCCLFQSGVLDHLDAAQWEELRHQIRSLILATDITRQPEFLCILRHYLETNYLDLKDEHNRHFVLQIALKCADICNPCRPWEISTRWSRKVCEEFFLQGDSERELGLPVTALCDRSSTTVAKIQSGFFRFVVAPLFEEWHRFLQTPLSSTLITNLRENQEKWAALEAEDVDREGKEKVAEKVIESERPTGILLSLSSDTVEKMGLFVRRHSVPINLPKTMSRIGSRLEGPFQFRAPFLASSSLTSPVEEENILSPSTSSSTTAQISRGLLVKQSTFPPVKPSGRLLHRQSPSTIRSSGGGVAQELVPKMRSSSSSSSSNSASGECKGEGKCCSNNGCGSPPSPLVITEDQQAFRLADGIDGAHKDWSSRTGLVRLKSDSDLLEHTAKATNGKSGGHRRAKEKENEDPIVCRIGSSLPPWKGRKGKSHGGSVVGYRWMSRRASAPVGLLLEDVAKGLARGLAEETGDKSRRNDVPTLLLVGDQLPSKNDGHVGDKRCSSRFNRRASLPTVLTYNSAVNTLTDFISVGLKRRSSVPADELFGLSTTRNSSFSELFPVPCRSRSSTGIDPASLSALFNHPSPLITGDLLPNGLVNSVRSSAHLLRQTQSFDAAFMGEMANLMVAAAAAAVTVKMPEQHQQVQNTEFHHSVQNSMFPSRRRGSVPVEACLLTMSSEDRTGSLVLDANCDNAVQS